MDLRELGMAEIMNRLDPLFELYPLKFLKRVPTERVTSQHMPCVLLLEGDDNIIKRHTGNYTGYPAQRVFNPIIEVWDLESGNVQNLRKQTLQMVLANNGLLVDKVILRESKTIGPFNLDEPGVLGMSVTFEMVYTDLGPF